MLKLDDLIEKEKEFELAGRIIKITEMGLKDLILISAWIATVVHKLPRALQGKTNAQDILMILKSVSEDEAAALFSIVLKLSTEEDLVFIKNNILSSNRIIAEVINLICDANGFDKTFESFKKAGEKLIPKLLNAAQKKETINS